MEIRYEMNNTVPFEKIETGKTCEHAGVVYIKLDRTYLDNGHTYNAFAINKAELACLSPDMHVIPVKSVLTIS